jgi:putative phage-type endonuclease
MIEQGSPEWLAQRVGRATASRISDIVARTKSGYGASRDNYMGELIAERLTGVPAERFTNAAMAWGTEKEAEARAAYQFEIGALVELAGFVDHPTIPMSGASPDGYVGSDGLVELKCPQTGTHIATLLGQVVPSKYVLQSMWQMACTGRKWCDFVSFDPRMPENMQLFVKRIQRDDDVISGLEKQVAEFLAELDAKLASLTSLYGRQEAA